MSDLEISPQALEAIKNFKLPANIGFGMTMSPVMMNCDYQNGNWGKLKMLPYGPISIDPSCKVLHYSQEIFEGMKSYFVDGEGPFLFRPNENAKRFQQSAQRMAMPEIPTTTFLSAVKNIVIYSKPFIPQKTGESLYIRPFMFAADESLGIKPSQSFKFMVLASPSSNYFGRDTLKVLIEREFIRAFPGGTGQAKTGGNYASGQLSAIKAAQHNCHQTLWLDGLKRENIEEMSGMNIFAVINNTLVTPKIGTTILDGITRRSIIELATMNNLKVVEEDISISKLTKQISRGECTELFSCGTATIITPIASLHEIDGTCYSLPKGAGPICAQLRKNLLDIQEGRSSDPKGWVVKVL